MRGKFLFLSLVLSGLCFAQDGDGIKYSKSWSTVEYSQERVVNGKWKKSLIYFDYSSKNSDFEAGLVDSHAIHFR